MNLANKLTLGRIFLVPIFLIFIAIKDIPYGSFIATFIFVIASITDKLDGYVARSRNQITNFGKFMDPLADKLLVTTALVTLVDLHVISSFAAIIIIAREFAVSGLRTVAASEGTVIAASKWGKAKTVVQIVAIIASLIKVNIGESIYLTNLINDSILWNKFFEYGPRIFMGLAVVITIISGVDYFVKNKHTISTDK